MSHQDLVDRYIAFWNETDPSRRNALAAATFAPTAAYVDPLMSAEGPQAIAAMVAGVQERFPGHRFRLTGGVDAVGSHIRFAWELGPDSGPVVVAGTDFCTVADDRLTNVTGFIDHIAEPASAAAE